MPLSYEGNIEMKTTKEQIEVMQAYIDGKDIEYCYKSMQLLKPAVASTESKMPSLGSNGMAG